MLSPHDLTALFITLKLAFISTFLLLIIGIPLAWWLARTRNVFKILIEALVAIPIVLPPTVLGFYLLVGFSPDNFFGELWLNTTGRTLAFSFSGLVIGSMIYSLPFVVQPLQNTFERIGKKPVETASLLGASPVDCFLSVVLPLCKRGIIGASILGFAHTVGEFGVVLMIGGNIPGETQVISIALFDHVESLEMLSAHRIAATLLVFSFITLLATYFINRNHPIRERQS